MMEINLARSAARFEGQSTTALAHAAHLQYLSGGKLVQIADERVTRVGSFGGIGFWAFKSRNDLAELAPEIAIAAIGRDDSNLLLCRPLTHTFLFGLNQDQNFERRKMLAGIGRLFERKRRFAFDDKEIEVLAHDDVDGLMQGAHDAQLHIRHEADDPKDSILENGIAVEDE
jgi:hypothetical protein